jgi:uncharacterized membrane protein YidH (DUF202 family)
VNVVCDSRNSSTAALRTSIAALRTSIAALRTRVTVTMADSCHVSFTTMDRAGASTRCGEQRVER